MDTDMSGLAGPGEVPASVLVDEKSAAEHAVSSDDELELALLEVSGTSTPEEPEVLAPEASVLTSLSKPISANPVPTPSAFKSPPNPSIPQDLAVIAELVNTYQAVGSLPPLTISAADKRRQVEASIRAKMEALKNSKGKGKEGDVGPATPMEEGKGEVEASAGPSTLEADAAMRSELDAFVGNQPTTGDAEDDSSSDSDSSSEFLSDSEADEDEEEGEEEFVFSNSPAPSPLKRPLKFEFIDDDEEPISSDPITSANEAPLPPVPQPPFSQLPKEEVLSLAGEVVSWMRERHVENWWEARHKAEAEAEAIREEIGKSVDELAAATIGAEPTVPEKVGGGNEGVKVEDGEEMEDGELDELDEAPAIIIDLNGSTKSAQSTSSASSSAEVFPRFTSSGTVVIRAMQQRPGQEGWLEEGSVVCHPDGRVLGFVSDTFGPLTSPFYSVRLPPPPFPLPSASSLTNGTRLSYPVNPQYRSFVNMLAVRDPRFKGSDASNIHDEEVGEEEAEWSDDEMEAEAKKRKKNNKKANANGDKGGWAPGYTGGGGGGVSHSLPIRPHFDYVAEGDDASDAASFYGGAGDMGEMDHDGGVSEAGSSASRRPAPMPYELDEAGDVGPGSGVPTEGERGSEGKRGRGQGRQRGGGRDAGGGGRGRGGGGGDRGGRGGREARGGGRGGREDRGGRGGGGDRGGKGDRGGRGRGGNRGGGGGNAQTSSRPNFGLPQKPQFDPSVEAPIVDIVSYGLPPPPPSLPTPPSSAVTGYDPSIPQSYPAYPTPGPAGFAPVDQYRPQQHQQSQQHQQFRAPQHPQQPGNQQPLPNLPHLNAYHQQSHPQQYHPQQQQQQPYQPQFPQHQHAQAFPYSPHQYNAPAYNAAGGGPESAGGGSGPAINPRFAAQYQQMQLMSHLAAWQGGGGQGDQGGGGNQGGGGGYGYSE